MGTRNTEKQIPDIEPVSASKRVANPVRQYELSGKYISTYPSISKASIDTKTNYSSLYLCLKGRLKTAGGFQWRYAK